MHEYLTVPEMADLFRKSPSWIYRNLKKWPHSRIGGEIRFDQADILAIREMYRQKPPEAAPVRRTGIRGQKRR